MTDSFQPMYTPKSMIINSTYTVYKRGTKTTRESRACLPVTGTFTFFKSFFFLFFFLQNTIWTAETCTNIILSNISFCPFQLTSITVFFFFFFLNRSTVCAASLRTCIKSSLSFKEKID